MAETKNDKSAPSGATLTITQIPELVPMHRREGLAMHAQAFGLETVTQGLNSAQDMPSNDAYTRAAGVGVWLLGCMERGESLSMALLVNIIADCYERDEEALESASERDEEPSNG